MTSSLSWLDVSADQQRRVRDLIRLFEEPGTRDEIGIGSIRDAFSELLFPGTSVIQTRARYFLIVPWHFLEATRRGLRGDAFLAHVERQERRLIDRFRQAGAVEGLIGRVAGARVKNLPSTIYWSGLTRLGILSAAAMPRTLSTISAQIDEGDELSARRPSAWHPTIPSAPRGFPDADSAGFDLTFDEASWLQERVADGAAGTLFASLVTGRSVEDIATFDAIREIPGIPSNVRDVVERAQHFSAAIHGAALLYNLLVAELYEAEGFTTVDSPVDYFRDWLTSWAGSLGDEVAALRSESSEFWHRARLGNPRVPAGAQLFVDSWLRIVDENGPASVADHSAARTLVSRRVQGLRGPRSLLANSKLLALWGGSSGADPLTYRWGTVRRLVLDIQEGLARARA